ncbi:MAG: hypothetical protein DME55_08320 [Verrucomicrobia bacterium]|nr:MAG: hypothetical protein DME55_08320 [Verrucomicrobiota bacterium]
MKHDTNGQILGNATTVIPSEVENGAAGKPRHRRPQAKRTGSERIKSRGRTQRNFAGSFDSASLRMTA